MFQLYNKIEGFAIVTGGSRGLGAAMAEELAREGYDVVINYVSDKSTPKAQALCEKLECEFGVGAIAVQANVAKYEECKKIVDAGVAAFGGRIAVLINNAGIQSNKPFHELSVSHYEELIGIELLGAMHLSHIVVPYMRAAKNGCIINISSVCALYGQVGQADYSAAKAGLIGFMRALSGENADCGVRVNCIAPGLIATDMVAGLPPEVVEMYRQTIPLGRLGLPDDVARSMAYILNDTYLTGQVISPNGGVAKY